MLCLYFKYERGFIMKLILKIIAIPFMLILTIGTPVFVFLFCYAAVFMEIASGIGVLLSIALLLTGEKLGCCVFLFLSFLLSPFGIPAIGEWLADRLRSINCSLRYFIVS